MVGAFRFREFFTVFIYVDVIYLERGINKVAVTLTEKVTIDSPYFLFTFVNDQTKAAISFLAADISDYTERYNLFNIEVVNLVSEQDLSAGAIYLDLRGYYGYTIRQQSSSSNLDPDQSGAVMEVGKMLFAFEAGETPTYEPELETVVYNN